MVPFGPPESDQETVGDECQWVVSYNVTLVNLTGDDVTIRKVDRGQYSENATVGSLKPGHVLHTGKNAFPKQSGEGPVAGCTSPGSPPPLVVTVKTTAGTVKWQE